MMEGENDKFSFGSEMFVNKIRDNEVVLDEPVTITRTFTIRNLNEKNPCKFFTFAEIFGDVNALSQEIAEWNLNLQALDTDLDIGKYPVLLQNVTVSNMSVVDPDVKAHQVGVTLGVPFPDAFNPFALRTASSLTGGALKNLFLFKPMRKTEVVKDDVEGAVLDGIIMNGMQMTEAGSCGVVVKTDSEDNFVVFDPIKNNYIPQEVREQYADDNYEDMVSRVVAFPLSVDELSSPGLVTIEQLSLMENERLVKKFMASVRGRPSEMWFSDVDVADHTGARKVSMPQYCEKINQLLTYFTLCAPTYFNKSGLFIDFKSDLVRLTSHISLTVTVTFQPVVQNPDNGTLMDKMTALMINFFSRNDK